LNGKEGNCNHAKRNSICSVQKEQQVREKGIVGARKGNNRCFIQKLVARKGTTIVLFKKRNSRRARRSNSCSIRKGTVGAQEGTTVVLLKKEQQAREKEQHRHDHVKEKICVVKQNGSMEQKTVLIVFICLDSCFLDNIL
jgi:hypothetical protein